MPSRTASSKGPPSATGQKPEGRVSLMEHHLAWSSDFAAGSVAREFATISQETLPLKGAMKFGASPCGKFCSVIDNKRKFEQRKILLKMAVLFFEGDNNVFVLAIAAAGGSRT